MALCRHDWNRAMANYALSLSSNDLRSLKNSLRDYFPSIKSAHLSEAFAAAAGFRTHAALLATLANGESVQVTQLNNHLFLKRLQELGYQGIEPFALGDLVKPHDARKISSNSTTNITQEALMPKLFFSYSHVDEALRDRLEVHLALMKHQELIQTWHDRRIVAGSNLETSIDENLESADVILLLVSADFLASWYCYSVEMKRALERHSEGTATVIPVILEPCDWHSAPFGKLLAVPRDGKAVTTWPNQAEAWTNVVQQIRRAVEAMNAASAEPSNGGVKEARSGRDGRREDFATPGLMKQSQSGSSRSMSERPRSSNLRLKKEFLDFDRDKFVHDAFDYMGKFFEASLEELSARNHGIQGRFQRRGDGAFSAVIYRDGKAISECSIRLGELGSRSPGIAFSYSASAPTGSFNEMLTVDSDSQSMYFKALGMQSYHGEQNAQLSEQGASEYFWGMLIERLQR